LVSTFSVPTEQLVQARILSSELADAMLQLLNRGGDIDCIEVRRVPGFLRCK